MSNVTPIKPNPFLPESVLYFRVVERESGWAPKNPDMPSHVVVPQEKALVRVGPGGRPIWLATVGKNYEVVQNKELMQTIERALLDEYPVDALTGAVVDDAMSYEGRWCSRSYTFPGVSVGLAEARGVNDVSLRIQVCNGFGKSSIQLLVGAWDFYCSNGMVIGVVERVVRRHTSGLAIPQLGGFVRGTIQSFKEEGERWQKWASVDIDIDAVEHVCRELPISARKAGLIVSRWYDFEAHERGPTLWALYSAMTHYASHGDVRDTGQDNTAATRVTRQREVLTWTRHPEFKRLEEAA